MPDRATVLFIPHGGGPLPLMEDPGHANLNRFLRDYPAGIERPDAIIVFSAHWEEAEISITSAAAPPLLFDYYGFPPETYEYRYPAPGHPELAGRVGQVAAVLLERRADGLLLHLLEADHPTVWRHRRRGFCSSQTARQVRDH